MSTQPLALRQANELEYTHPLAAGELRRQHAEIARQAGEIEALKKREKVLVEALEYLLEDTQHADHDCHDVDCPVYVARAALALALAFASAPAPSQHPDDIAVDKFAEAMKAKMAKQRAKGYSGWDDENQFPAERLQSMLANHVAKGDPVDVGNFAMMLWNRDERTAAPSQQAEQPDCRLCAHDPECERLGAAGFCTSGGKFTPSRPVRLYK